MCFLGKLVKKSFLGQLLAVATLQGFVLLIDLEENHNYMFSVMCRGAVLQVLYCCRVLECGVLVQKTL